MKKRSKRIEDRAPTIEETSVEEVRRNLKGPVLSVEQLRELYSLTDPPPYLKDKAEEKAK